MYNISGEFPFLDIVKKDNHLIMILDVPGLRPDDIILKLNGDKLTITTPKPQPEKVEGEYFIMERCHQEIKRNIRLPSRIDPDSVKTTLSRGVLTIKFKITKEVTPVRTIQLL